MCQLSNRTQRRRQVLSRMWDENRALLAVPFRRGLRRAEASILSFHHIEQREGRWAIVDIIGKRDKMRTVPMLSRAKACLDTMTQFTLFANQVLSRRYPSSLFEQNSSFEIV